MAIPKKKMSRQPTPKLRVFKEFEIDHGLVLAPGVPYEESEAGDEEEEGPADPNGTEPV